MPPVVLILDDVRFWMIALEESRRTILVSPTSEARVRQLLTDFGLTGLHDVIVSPAVPDTAIYIIDENTIEAGMREDAAEDVKT